MPDTLTAPLAVSPPGRRVLEKVMAHIREVSPQGLGHWTPAWELVAEPGDRFLDAFRLWEEEDSPETRQALQWAAVAFVGAWREAARQWEAEGRPTAGEEVPA